MFVELNNLLSWSPSQLPLGSTIFVKDSCDEGALVLHHLLSLFLKSNGNVCLLGLAQSFTHYNSVANRLSLNLNKMKQDGRFVFVDAMQHIGNDLKCRPEKAGGDDPWVNFAPGQPHSALKGLFHHLKGQLGSLNENTIVILDDVSILVSLGIPVQDVVYFTEYLKKEMQEQGGTLAVLCHCTVEDDDIELLWKQLSYHSDVIFEVRNLPTGFCRDVHGEMKLTVKHPSLFPDKTNVREVQFKISDRNVNFFAIGLSAAVIGH